MTTMSPIPINTGALPERIGKFGKWLGYKGKRRYLALYFAPRESYSQQVICDDGQEFFALGEEAWMYFVGTLQGCILLRYGIDLGFVVEPSEPQYWLIVDTQSNALYGEVKDSALQWIASQKGF